MFGEMVMTEPSVCAFGLCFPRSRYTGKERDTESGNDYFMARYYSSNMGRFMSPDWSAKEEPVLMPISKTRRASISMRMSVITR